MIRSDPEVLKMTSTLKFRISINKALNQTTLDEFLILKTTTKSHSYHFFCTNDDNAVQNAKNVPFI